MAELQNQVTLASWEKSQLSDKNMALREKNLSQQASFGQGQPQGQTTPSQPAPEPVLFQEPTLSPVENPKVEPTKSPVTPSEIKPAKVEAPQDELNRIQQEVNVKGQINSLNLQEKAWKIAEFTGLVQSGVDTKILADYARNNPALWQDFNAILKTQFKNRANIDFYSKYNGVSNDKLYASVKTGDITVWDAKYNLLPETQRQSFEAFQRAKDAGNVPQTKEDLINFDSPQYKVDFTEIETLTSKLFSSDLRTKLEEARNDPRVVDLETQLNWKAVEIEKFDLATMKASRTLKDELGNAGYTPAYISATVRDDEEARRLERMEMMLEYNGIQANLSTIKSDIDSDIELYKYEDQLARDQYKTALEMYETRRSEQVQARSIEDQRAYESEQQAFLEKNKQLAEERQNAFQKELIKIDQDFEMKNQKPVYELGRDGKMYAILNGSATVVKSDIGEVMFWEEAEKYQKQIYKNDDGTFTEVTTYKDGRATSVSTYDIEGSKVTWAPDSIQDIIAQCRIEGWCWEGANDYAQKLGLGRIFQSWYDKPVAWETDYKTKYIQEWAWPQVWGFAIWNPNQGQGKYKENWHVGIVTGYNEKTGKVTITDWNYNNDKKQSTHDVNLSEITFNGGFYNPDFQEQQFDKNKTPLYAKFNAWKMSQTQELKYADDEEFLNQALAYGESIAQPWYKKIEDLITLANKVKDLNPLERWYPSNSIYVDKLLGRAGMQELLDLKSQGATFGSLTEGEFTRIQSAVLDVWMFTPTWTWNNILDDYITTLKRGLPIWYEIQDAVVEIPEKTWAWNLMTEFDDTFNDNELNSIFNK